MTITSHSIANVKQAVPFFWVKSIEESLRYYVDGLGFEMTHKWMVDGKVRWCWLQLGGAALMLQEFVMEGHDANPPKGRLGKGVSINFICEDALAFYREVKSRSIRSEPKPFVGNRMWVTSLSDPDGYKLFFESPTDAAEESEYEGS